MPDCAPAAASTAPLRSLAACSRLSAIISLPAPSGSVDDSPWYRSGASAVKPAAAKRSTTSLMCGTRPHHSWMTSTPGPVPGDVAVARVTVALEGDHLSHARTRPYDAADVAGTVARHFVRSQSTVCTPSRVTTTMAPMTVLDTHPADAFANDRAHVFHSWSAQGAHQPARRRRRRGQLVLGPRTAPATSTSRAS